MSCVLHVSLCISVTVCDVCQRVCVLCSLVLCCLCQDILEHTLGYIFTSIHNKSWSVEGVCMCLRVCGGGGGGGSLWMGWGKLVVLS